MVKKKCFVFCRNTSLLGENVCIFSSLIEKVTIYELM